jgi:hypothetical protein
MPRMRCSKTWHEPAIRKVQIAMLLYPGIAPPTRRRRARGLSLVEVMVCTSLMAMLFLAVGIFFRASLAAYRDHQQRSTMLWGGRRFLQDITAALRVSDDAAPYDPTAAISTSINRQYQAGGMPGYPDAGLSSDGGDGVAGIQILKQHPDRDDPNASPANPVILTYWFDKPNRRVLMKRQQSGTTSDAQVVCTCVQSMAIYMQPAPGSAAGRALRRAVVQISLANRDAQGNPILAGGGQDLTLTLADAAWPRRNFAPLN